MGGDLKEGSGVREAGLNVCVGFILLAKALIW